MDETAPTDPTSSPDDSRPAAPIGNETIRVSPADIPAWAGGSTRPAPAVEPTFGETTENAELPPPSPVARKRRSPAVIGGALVGALAIVAGGAFAVTQLGADNGNTPEAAMRALIASIEKGDVIGIAEAMAPGERDVVLQSGVPMIDQLKRLEILDPKLDLKKVSGYEAKFSDVKMVTKPLRDDLAEVRVQGGNFSGSFDPARLPAGKYLRELIGEPLATAEPASVTDQALSDGGDTGFVSSSKMVAGT